MRNDSNYMLAMCKIYYLLIYSHGDLTEDEFETGKGILMEEGIFVDSLELGELTKFLAMTKQEQMQDIQVLFESV